MEAQKDFNQYLKQHDQYLAKTHKEETSKFLAEKRSKFTESTSENDAIVNLQESSNRMASALLQAIEAQDYTLATESAEKMREIISVNDDPPLEELLKTNIVPTLINFIRPENFQFEKLLHEFSWILANIAAGDGFYVQYLVDLDVIQKAFDLLQHDNIGSKENAIFLLANIAGESLEYRDQLLQKDIVDLIVSVYSKYVDGDSETFIEDLAWLLSVLTRGTPYPDFEKIRPFLTMSTDLLHKYKSQNKVVEWTLRTFSHFSDGGNEQIQKIFDLNCVERILAFLQPKAATTTRIKISVLKFIGNLATGEHSHVEALMKLNVVDSLGSLLSDNTKLIRREAVWALSNILKVSPEARAYIFEYQDGKLIRRFIYMNEHDDFQVAQECIYALANICTAGNLEQIQELVDQNIIELLVHALKENNDTKLLAACLEALGAVLKEYKAREGFSARTILEQLASCGGYDVIEAFQNHTDNQIYSLISDLIDKYFECTD